MNGLRGLVLGAVAGLVLAVPLAGTSAPARDLYPFDDPVLAERFWRLARSLRCLVCQNQSVAESGADLARDIRAEIYKQLRAGATDRQIVDWMLARYGEFVLLRPPLRPGTVALWAAPAVLALVGVVLLLRLTRASRKAVEVPELSPRERELVERLLGAAQGEERS
ncbi:cytochrome c-type biogenesis protein [Inmirania thermothiophila]|uniref:Cytochrome c-type biogenesis protein n=1 Tax=Inmirania thermothiophila TaxID=1750597 RepID=A0A3N1Y780_9GAMM|nr:cytochrome c-type biogenesis protein [Inmirania thermothiophila]ROR34388.1 cytochrome c-type biogenesis protein CcmH [Inmirania thermothiophila]